MKKIKVLIFFILLMIVLVLTITSCTNPQPPWLNIEVYTNTSQKIRVNTDDEFIIRFTMSYNLLPIIREVYDDNMVTLLDRKINVTKDKNQPSEYSWFLFKANRTGKTQITIKHLLHITEALEDEKIFTVVIE